MGSKLLGWSSLMHVSTGHGLLAAAEWKKKSNRLCFVLLSWLVNTDVVLSRYFRFVDDMLTGDAGCLNCAVNFSWLRYATVINVIDLFTLGHQKNKRLRFHIAILVYCRPWNESRAILYDETTWEERDLVYATTIQKRNISETRLAQLIYELSKAYVRLI